MADSAQNQYDQRNIDTMQMLYGPGYLSMVAMTKLPASFHW